MSLCVGPRNPPSAVPPPTRFNHVKCAPSPAIAPFVEHYWLSRWDRRGVPARAAAVLSDPCIHILIQDGRANVMGVVRGTHRMHIEDEGCVVGIKFRPAGFYPFAPKPSTQWTNRLIPVEDVFDVASESAWAPELSHAAVDCRGDAAAHAAVIAPRLDAFLGARLPARDQVAEEVGKLVSSIASSAEIKRVADLVDACGRSERTLHRLFARYIGVSPAWVIRRYRLHAAAQRLTANPPADVRAVAWELGYADQAHFIRDFRATIGVTPGAYVHARV